MQETNRKHWLSILAKASVQDLDVLVAENVSFPKVDELRAPEIGSVMVRGRMGGTGDAFNMGEMTVSRCSISLQTGEVGHGYVQGRNKAKAKQVAILDALLQTAQHDHIMRTVIAPLENSLAGAKSVQAAKAAATKVEFFTLVRGEDQ